MNTTKLIAEHNEMQKMYLGMLNDQVKTLAAQSRKADKKSVLAFKKCKNRIRTLTTFFAKIVRLVMSVRGRIYDVLQQQADVVSRKSHTTSVNCSKEIALIEEHLEQHE